MKSWPAVIALVAFTLVAVTVRRSLRGLVVEHLVRNGAATAASGRARAIAVFGGAALAGGCVLAAGFALRAANEPWAIGRYLAAALVIALIVPVMTLGSPRMTRWQTTFRQRLDAAGMAPAAADAAASVARPVAALGVLYAVATVPLLV